MEENTFSFSEAETINLDMNQEGKIENFMLGVSFRNPSGMKTINFHRIFTITIEYWSHEK